MTGRRKADLQTPIFQKILKNTKVNAYNIKNLFGIKFVTITSNIKKILTTSNLMLL